MSKTGIFFPCALLHIFLHSVSCSILSLSHTILQGSSLVPQSTAILTTLDHFKSSFISMSSAFPLCNSNQMHMVLHHHKNSEIFRLGRILASHMFHPLSQSRVNSELRVGIPALCSVRSWKTLVMEVPQPLWETKLRAQGLVIPLVKFYLHRVSAPCCNLWLLSLILPLCTSKRRLTLPSQSPHRLTSLYFLGSHFFPFLKIGATLPFYPLSKPSPNLHYPSDIAESDLTMPSVLSTPLNIPHLVPQASLGWDSQEIPDSGIWALLLMPAPLILNPVSRHKGLGGK